MAAQALANRRSVASRRSRRRIPFLRYLLLVVLSVIWAVPVAWMVLTSVKPEAQIITVPPHWLPDQLSDFTLQHYIDVLFFPRGINLIQSFTNSIFVAAIGTLLVVIVDVLAGYAFARLRFPGRDLLFAVVVASLIVPGEILLIPNYITVWRLGWLNTYNALIFPPLAGGFGVFLMRQFLLSIPHEIEDAALIDGCNRFQLLWSIVIPLARGAIATLAIFTFLYFWNEFTWPYIVINEASKMTMPVALIQFRADYWSNYGQLMAGTTVSALPAILIFLAAQRMIIRSITLTGVKG
jgi:multiple sugar transport system permease protein